jgi:hypothetical protein
MNNVECVVSTLRSVSCLEDGELKSQRVDNNTSASAIEEPLGLMLEYSLLYEAFI